MYYYITSSDPDPHNFSCKRFVIDEECNWVCGNNEGSDNWDALVHREGGEHEALQYLIGKLDQRRATHNRCQADGCWISRITADDIETLF